MHYTIPEQAAKDEAKIYEELSDVQGKLVPHFYGMHTVSYDHFSLLYSSL
jgi:hypothetical protein